MGGSIGAAFRRFGPWSHPYTPGAISLLGFGFLICKMGLSVCSNLLCYRQQGNMAMGAQVQSGVLGSGPGSAILS